MQLLACGYSCFICNPIPFPDCPEENLVYNFTLSISVYTPR